MQVVVDSILTNYQDVGKGPVLVCVHGWMHSLVTYEQLTTELKDSYRVVSLDLPNFGKSQITEDVQSIEGYGKFLAAFVAKLGIDEYILVGHSMGAQIAMYATASNLIRPAKLVLIGAAGIRDNRKVYKLFLRGASKIVRHLVPKAVKAKFYSAIGSDYNPDLSDIHKKVIQKTLTTDIQSAAASITVPTLLIYGENDASTPPWMGKKLAQIIPSAQFKLVDGERHWPHQTSAPEVAKYIKDFV